MLLCNGSRDHSRHFLPKKKWTRFLFLPPTKERCSSCTYSYQKSEGRKGGGRGLSYEHATTTHTHRGKKSLYFLEKWMWRGDEDVRRRKKRAPPPSFSSSGCKNGRRRRKRFITPHFSMSTPMIALLPPTGVAAAAIPRFFSLLFLLPHFPLFLSLCFFFLPLSTLQPFW